MALCAANRSCSQLEPDRGAPIPKKVGRTGFGKVITYKGVQTAYVDRSRRAATRNPFCCLTPQLSGAPGHETHFQSFGCRNAPAHKRAVGIATLGGHQPVDITTLSGGGNISRPRLCLIKAETHRPATVRAVFRAARAAVQLQSVAHAVSDETDRKGLGPRLANTSATSASCARSDGVAAATQAAISSRASATPAGSPGSICQ